MIKFFFAVLFAVTGLSLISFTAAALPAGPALVFPVAGKKSNIGSFWGDSRDGGKRKHEGIDIFAKKGTPVVAICDGVITSVGNGGIGGKTVWLQSDDHGWTAYYAHLDEQHVHRGQVVKKGQVLGTVGKTGNAKYTPAHLHFGIYTWSGAVNPLPYVKNAGKIAIPGKNKDQDLSSYAKNSRKPDNSLAKTPQEPEFASFPAKYVYKTLKLSSDPRSAYYVTTRMNVVRMYQGQLQVIGKYKKANSSKYPYQIALENNKQLYINRAGKLLSASGKQVGSVS